MWVRVKICDAAGYAIVRVYATRNVRKNSREARGSHLPCRGPHDHQVLSSGLHHTGGVPRAAVEPLISSTAWTSSSSTTSSTHGHAAASASSSAAAPHFNAGNESSESKLPKPDSVGERRRVGAHCGEVLGGTQSGGRKQRPTHREVGWKACRVPGRGSSIA